jgi:hypothetical protein
MSDVTTSSDDKARESRLRRMAQRQGFRLFRSSRRDSIALGAYGYVLVDPYLDCVVAGEIDSPRALDLDGVEAFLLGAVRHPALTPPPYMTAVEIDDWRLNQL